VIAAKQGSRVVPSPFLIIFYMFVVVAAAASSVAGLKGFRILNTERASELKICQFEVKSCKKKRINDLYSLHFKL
jgi:hypothetical protein